MFQADTGALLTSMSKHSAQVRGLAFSPDGRLWELSEDSRPKEELVRLAQLLDCRRIDGKGGVMPVDRTALSNIWQELRRK